MTEKILATLRNKKELTQADMAKYLNIATSTYNMYENGLRRVPDNIATSIAEIFEVKKEEIFLPATFTISKTTHSA